MSKLTLLLVLSLIFLAQALGGCATAVKPGAPVVTASPITAAEMPSSAVQDKLTADLNAAIAHATAAKDAWAPVRLACWQTLLPLVAQLPTLPSAAHDSPAGVFDAYELGAEKAEVVEEIAGYQVPEEVKVKLATGCGPVVARFNAVLARFNVRLVRLGARLAIIGQ